MTDKRYLTPKQVAEMLQVSIRTVQKWAEQKKLPGKQIGNLWRFDPDEIEQFMKSQDGQKKEAE